MRPRIFDAATMMWPKIQLTAYCVDIVDLYISTFRRMMLSMSILRQTMLSVLSDVVDVVDLDLDVGVRNSGSTPAFMP